MRTTLHDRHRCAQNVDHLAHSHSFSPVFAEVVCTVGTTPPQTVISPPPKGGNGVIRTTTRRRHAASQPLMLQNPHRYRRGGHRATSAPKAPPVRTAEAGGTDTTASQISHVIYRGHFSRCPKNVAIPTTQIQCLNQSSRNYVRNCWLTAIAGHQGNAPSRRTEPPIEAHGTDGSRAAHGAARPQGRARLPDNPRVHKQQTAPHSNT